MSVRAVLWVLDASESRLADRLVLIALADEADDDGGSCRPSQRRIARRAHIGQTTARRSIDRLEGAGELLVKRPEKPAPGRHSHYHLTMGRDPAELAASLGWPEPRLDSSIAAEWAAEAEPDEPPRTAPTVAQSIEPDRANGGAEPRQTEERGTAPTVAQSIEGNRAGPRPPEWRGTAPDRAALRGADPLTPTSDPRGSARNREHERREADRTARAQTLHRERQQREARDRDAEAEREGPAPMPVELRQRIGKAPAPDDAEATG